METVFTLGPREAEKTPSKERPAETESLMLQNPSDFFCCFGVGFFVCLFAVLQIEPKVLQLVGKYCTTQAMCPQPSIPGSNLYYRAIVTKTAWYCFKKRHVEQWTRREDPGMSPHT
jgi:hypothetical protein